MVVIDQHALHERILYEQLREKVLAGDMETQRLLVPEPVPLPPAEAAAALEAKETLAQLGIEVEPFGGDTVLVSSYPAMRQYQPGRCCGTVEELVFPTRHRSATAGRAATIARKRPSAAIGWPRRRLRSSWSSDSTIRTPTIARTDGPLPSFSAVRSWTGVSSERRKAPFALP
jgi:hypothetical protein